jgi:2,4-dienoyl-CoA reductase-like NADH-dependent reductase (Old Yellow Enzyme family)
MTHLSTPLSLSNKLTLDNRLAKSAMSERLATRDGRVSAELVRLYERWARSGAGLLVTGNVMVDARALGERGNVVAGRRRARPRGAANAWAQAAGSAAGAQRAGCSSTTRAEQVAVARSSASPWSRPRRCGLAGDAGALLRRRRAR